LRARSRTRGRPNTSPLHQDEQNFLSLERLPPCSPRCRNAERPEVLEGRQLMLSTNTTDRRLQLAGIILVLGLLVEGSSLMGRGPIPFLVFVGVGGLLLLVGMVAFLLALVRANGTKA